MEKARVFGAAALIYYAFRLLGANKVYAWDQAKKITVNAVMDKAIEITGVRDPRSGR